MDLMDYSETTFNNIVSDYHDFAQQIGIKNITAIPVSALAGDNITEASTKMPWYSGPTLMQHLENTPLKNPGNEEQFTMPIQWVNRPNLDFRGFSGQISSGIVHAGESIQVLPSGKKSRIKSIVTFDGEINKAIAGQSVTLTLEDEIDISRGDIIVSEKTTVEVARNFLTTLLWMNESQLVPGKVLDKNQGKSFNRSINASKLFIKCEYLRKRKL